MGYWLISVHRDTRLQYALLPGVTTIGRDAHNDLTLPSQTVSRYHAEIVVTGDTCLLTDLGSTNGTQVNGTEIDGQLTLHAEDIVTFGRVRVKLSEHEDSSVPTWTDDEEISESVRLRREDTGPDAAGLVVQDSDLLGLLVEAGQVLVMPGDPGDSFDRLLELVEKAVSARRILLLLTDDDGNPVQHAARVQGSCAGSPLFLSRKMMRTVLDDGSSFLTNDAKADARFRDQESVALQDLRAAMAVPLQHNDEILGVLYADTSTRAVWTKHDLRVLALVGRILGTKIGNQRLIEQAQDDARTRADLIRARDIQRRLLPQEFPVIPGYTVHGTQEMSTEVGGDLYDAGLLPDGRKVQILLGDVTGKSLGAALIMSEALATIRALRGVGLSPGELVLRLHRHLVATTELTDYVTLFLGDLDPGTHRLEYVNAGHPRPYLVLPSGEVQPLAAERNFAAGMLDLPDLEFRTDEVEFPPGANLILYSDGITEAQHGEEFFDEGGRFLEALSGCASRPPAAAIRCLRNSVDRFLGDHPLTDDVTLLVVHRDP